MKSSVLKQAFKELATPVVLGVALGVTVLVPLKVFFNAVTAFKIVETGYGEMVREKGFSPEKYTETDRCIINNVSGDLATLLNTQSWKNISSFGNGPKEFDNTFDTLKYGTECATKYGQDSLILDMGKTVLFLKA